MRFFLAVTWVGFITSPIAAEPALWTGTSGYCPPAPDLVRSAIHLFTQEQAPPGHAQTLARPAPSFHAVSQAPPQFVSAPLPPNVRLAQFCPPSVGIVPYSPPCVATFHIHTPPPQWLSLPPRPNIQLAYTVEQPAHYGLPLRRSQVSIVHQPIPHSPVCYPSCLYK